MDIQIRLDDAGAVEAVCGGEEMNMELNSNRPYLVSLVDGELQAKPA